MKPSAIIFYIALLLATFGAYIQHFITTIGNEQWVLFAVGALLPPVGVLHAWLIWLGVL